jgi:hypothetical protein
MKKLNFIVAFGSICLICAVGITIRASAESAVLAQTPRLRLDPDLTIGTMEGDENLMLGSATRIDLDGAGNIYVLDYKDRLIRIFKKDGAFLRTISVPAGQGPKEAANLSGIAVTPKGTLYVNDTRKVIVYDPQGNFVRSFLVDFMISSIGCPGTEEIVAVGPHAGHILHVFNAEGKLMASFGDPFSVPAEFEAFKEMPMFVAPLLLDCSKDGRVFVLNPHRYEISIFKDRRLERILKGTSPLFFPLKKMGAGFVSTAAHVVESGGRVFVVLQGLDPRLAKKMDVFEGGRHVETLDVKGLPYVADLQGRIYFAELEDFPKVVRYSVIGD